MDRRDFIRILDYNAQEFYNARIYEFDYTEGVRLNYRHIGIEPDFEQYYEDEEYSFVIDDIIRLLGMVSFEIEDTGGISKRNLKGLRDNMLIDLRTLNLLKEGALIEWKDEVL